MTTSVPRGLSYDLDEGMLKAIAEEFAPQQVAERFATALAKGKEKAIEKVGREVFEDFGRRWMKRSLELGEKHTDATYEILKKAISQTGTMYFPLVPQRFVEIAYLGVMSFLALKVVQNNGRRLVYRVKPCDIYQGIKEKCGVEVASQLHCRYGCLAALETLFQDLDIVARVEMEATLPKEGWCQFAATRLENP